MTGRDMLHHRRVRALDDQGQHAFLALAGGKRIDSGEDTPA
jgi:hypothetical protein